MLFASLCWLSPAFAATAPQQAIIVEEVGRGAPLIFLPALGCRGEEWKPVADLLADKYHSLMISIPGFGGLPGRQPNFAGITTAVLELIKDRKLDRPVLVGHSFGGYLALQLATRDPDSFSAIVILDAYPFPAALLKPGISPGDARGLASMFRNLILALPDDQYRDQQSKSLTMMITADRDRQMVLNWTLASDRETVAAAQSAMISSDLRPALKNARVPILVLGSWRGREAIGMSHDSVDSALKEQYSGAPHATIVVSDTARHFLPLDDPAWVAGQIGSLASK